MKIDFLKLKINAKMVQKFEFSYFRWVSREMKFFSRLFLILGTVGMIYVIVRIFIDYRSEEWEGFQAFFEHLVSESMVVGILMISLISLTLGKLLLNKVRKRGRIFY